MKLQRNGLHELWICYVNHSHVFWIHMRSLWLSQNRRSKGNIVNAYLSWLKWKRHHNKGLTHPHPHPQPHRHPPHPPRPPHTPTPFPSAAYLRQWIGSALVQKMACRLFGVNPFLNQLWVIVNCTLKNKIQWNFDQNTKNVIFENASENVVWEMAAILTGGDELIRSTEPLIE